MTENPLELLKLKRKVCELLGNELDRNYTEEENVQMKAVQSCVDEVQHRNELDVVKAELVAISEDLKKTMS